LFKTENYTYDPAGNLTQFRDRKHQATVYVYDALNRRTSATYADSSDTTYTYDKGNRLTQINDSTAGNIIRTYDGLDRLTSEQTPQGTVGYTYDAASRRATMTVPGQTPISYIYDNGNHLTLDSFSTMFRVPSADRLEESLAIGASHGPSIRLVPELLARFQSQFPRLHVAVRTGTSKEIELLLRKRTVEVAFLSNPSNASALTIEPIASERLLFVVANKFPIAKSRVITTSELAELPLVVGAGQDGKTPAVDVIQRGLPAKLKLNVRTKFNSPGALRAAVTRGMGVGVLYEDMVLDELRDGSLKELTVAGLNLAGHSSLAYLKDQAMSPVAAQFVEVARLYKDTKPNIETSTESASKRNALPGLIGKQQTPKRDAAGVLIER
jgi:YD repeat-containing protein